MTDTMTSAADKAQARQEVAIWRYRLSTSPEDAAAFLNQPPAQTAGQAMVCRRDDGRVDTWYFL
ncbi:hypothetical protein OF117_07345 [Geodermatophilus sp. YIM 151500]|uniref:hypothetical protein n=1 Tax=Geodermatophilus sp. YIM 151500 TaxID=2984531 RepID=UPI0021E37C80|nr:hypothetical protein [Geodermatophilus sp. YIM 151500]MCV2489175.1 hypothetical protein [Geodermatophilus sp. YIM 151500]